MAEQKRGSTGHLIGICLVATLGGLLFGYDTAVINGANEFFAQHFGIDTGSAIYGWACSSALVGCIIGAMSGGFMGDFIGRRKSLLICAVLFGISAVGSALPETVTQFVTFRIIGGIGVGAASMLSPMYIAEIAPARLRGRLVSMNQLAIVVGILLAFFANYFIQAHGEKLLVDGVGWNTVYGWRWMFGTETVAALLFFVLLLCVPNSPRFLMARGKNDDARAVLCKVGSAADANAQMTAISAALSEEKGTFADLLRPGMKVTLLIGVALAVFQQWTGINAIMYYSTQVFKEAGFTNNTAFISSVGVGVANLLCTFIGIALVDRLGRKKLLIGGAVVQAVALTVVAVAFALKIQGIWVLISIFAYVGAFSASLGPVVWVVISEIFPTKIRGRAMSVATLALWTACYLLSQTFPILLKSAGAATTFGIFAVMSVFCALFVAKLVPETKGKTLEEIEAHWGHPEEDQTEPLSQAKHN